MFARVKKKNLDESSFLSVAKKKLVVFKEKKKEKENKLLNEADIEAGGRNADYVFARRFDNTQCRRDNEDDFIALTRGLWLNNPIGGERKIKKRRNGK